MLGRNASSGVTFSVPLLKATILNNFLVALQFSAALFFDMLDDRCTWSGSWCDGRLKMMNSAKLTAQLCS